MSLGAADVAAREALAPFVAPDRKAPVEHTILALDPGKTTGICEGYLKDTELTLIVDQQELSLSALYELLSKFLELYNPLSIIYEDFQYRNYARSGLDLTPVKIIGVIEMFREWHEPFVGFYKQSAATGKAFFNDFKLKELGAYKVGKQHGRDATRHLLQWAYFGPGAQFIDLDKLQVKLG